MAKWQYLECLVSKGKYTFKFYCFIPSKYGGYKLIGILASVILLVSSCANESRTNIVGPKGPFLGLEPKNDPQLLLPHFIASPLVEFNGTFNPEGTEFYYTSVVEENFSKGLITFTKMKEDSTWTSPAIASFSGESDDYDPLFSPDGSRLYFSSRRHVNDSLIPNKSNIWYVERNEDGWGEPKVIVLTAQNDYYSSLTKEGVIYFNVWATGNLFKAVPSGDSFKVTELDSTVNKSYDQGDPFVSPEEDYIIFRGYDEDSYGRGDLYISFNINDEWTSPENLGEPINSSAHEMCPYVSSDGKLFIFASARLEKSYKTEPLTPISEIQRKFKSADNGELNLYYMKTDFIQNLKEKHLNKD